MSALLKAAALTNIVDAAVRNTKSVIKNTKQKKKRARSGRKTKSVTANPQARAVPVAYSNVMSTRMPTMADVSIPFSGLDIVVRVNNAGLGETVCNCYDGTYAAIGLDLSPYSAPGHPAAFGTSLQNLSKCFAQFRLKRLALEFIPIKPTSTAGLIGIACTSDPWDAAPPDIISIGSSAYNIFTNVWQAASLDITSMVAGEASRLNWYSTYTNSISSSESRTTSPGSVVVFASGIGTSYAPNDTIGFLRFSGVIEFRSLSRVDILSRPPPPVASDLPSQPPQLIRSEGTSKDLRFPGKAGDTSDTDEEFQPVSQGSEMILPRVPTSIGRRVLNGIKT